MGSTAGVEAADQPVEPDVPDGGDVVDGFGGMWLVTSWVDVLII